MRYAKSLLAVLATVVTAVVAAMTDSTVTPAEWINVAITGVAAAGIFAAPNVPGARWTKGILAVLAAVLAFLASAISDGLTTAELLQIVVIGLGALGVVAVPNRAPAAGSDYDRSPTVG